MGNHQTSSIARFAKGLFLAATFAQAALADQPATTALPDLMMAQLRDAAQTAAAEVLPINATVSIGSSGMVFPPLTLPNPADPAFLNSLHNTSGVFEAWTGWADGQANLGGIFDSTDLGADLAASSFLEDTNAALAQVVYGMGPNFDLLSIYQVPEPNNPAPAAAQAASEPAAASEAGFFNP